MPKRVDPVERRRRIAEATWTIAAAQGMEEVTLRGIAAEANISMGQIQHYFATKDEMIRFACEYMVTLTEQGLLGALPGSPTPGAARPTIHAFFLQMLPLDEDRRTRAGIRLAFLVRAFTDQDLAVSIRRTWTVIHDLIAGQLRTAQEDGDISGDVDVDREAVALLSLMEGLLAHLLLGHSSVEEVLAIVDYRLDQLFLGVQEQDIGDCPV